MIREFETEEFEDNGDEENFEIEANEMLKLWDRDQLMKEVEEGKEQLRRDQENRKVDYYDGETDFETMILQMEALDGDQVYIKIIESHPDAKQVNGTNTILFDRIGHFEHEIMPFESTIHEGKPCKLDLMQGPIIPGLLQALLCMREGERANILIRPSMAYGRLGCPPLIPQNASIFYNVKIYRIWEGSKLDGILEYERSAMVDFPIDDKLEFVREHKDIANKYQIDDRPRDAIVMYKAAIKCLDELPDEMQQRKDVQELLETLLQNSAITFNKLGMHRSATKAARRTLFINPNNIKGFFQLIKSRISLADYSGAIRWLETVDKISPNDQRFDKLRIELDFKTVDEKRKRDEIMMKMSRVFK